MNDESKVFKLVGPVLMAVDFAEAKQNVAKRLEFIETEIKKVDNQIAVCTESQNRLADEVWRWPMDEASFSLYDVLTFDVSVDVLSLCCFIDYEDAD